jgi:hypothetical protein
MLGGRELHISVLGGFSWYGQQNEGGRCRATKECNATIFLSVYCESLASVRFDHFTPSSLKKRTTALCTSLVQIDSGAAMFTGRMKLTH